MILTRLLTPTRVDYVVLVKEQWDHCLTAETAVLPVPMYRSPSELTKPGWVEVLCIFQGLFYEIISVVWRNLCLLTV